MTAPIHGVDHLQVVARDLEMAKRTWARLGFTLTPRGRHQGRGTGNYCIMLNEGYIELIGIVDEKADTRNLERHLAIGPGAIGLAFGSADPEAAASLLAREGYRPVGPTDLARGIELKEGEQLLRFRLVNPADGTVPGFRAFVCHHTTPALTRRPEWVRHANESIAVERYTIAAAEPGPVVELFQRWFGKHAVDTVCRHPVVDTGREAIEIVPPASLASRFPGVEAQATRPLPCIVALTLRVSDIKRTRAALESTGVDPKPGPKETLIVHADEATGVIVSFVGG
ncbi:MAG: VOC family protein [Proteobacteria bacterium]|nr:VOC family protein [Pseudomonadota bacterium]MBI3497579.1 VOC family protein [Pseudomonadota bacterium]